MPNYPNIILISADEMRADCLECLVPGEVKTPSLNQLADRGKLFTRHFANFPKCVPSRISLFTGRYPATDGFRDIFRHLPSDYPCLKSHLKAREYETVLLGKNHVWAGRDFSSFVDMHSWSRFTSPHWQNWCKPEIAFEDYGEPSQRESMRVGCSQNPIADDIYTAQAISYLEQKRPFHKPFLMVLNLENPHPVYAVDEPYYSMYDRDLPSRYPLDPPSRPTISMQAQLEVRAKGVSDAHARAIQTTYHGMVSRSDALVGQVMETLDKLHLWENTIVVFFSDHGDWAGQFRLGEKWDTSFHEAMIHIPLIMAGPGIEPGSRYEGLSDMSDVAPMLFALLRETPPWPMHGRDLLAPGASPRRAVYSAGGHEQTTRDRFHQIHRNGHICRSDRTMDKQEIYARYPDSMAKARMVRTETHKLVFRETGDHELYNLQTDPWELDNRWDEYGCRAKREELQLLLLEHLTTTGGDYPPITTPAA